MEISSINRLQFRHNPNVFASKQEAITEFNKIFWEEKGNSSSDPYSLLAEPTILLYENEDEPNFLAGTTTKRNPHAILAIGVNSNNNSTYNENRYIFIDVHDIYTRIKGNKKAIEDAIRILAAKALDSDSLLFFAQSGETGTLFSGDVRIAQDYRIYNTTEEKWETLPNNLACADGADNSQKGMYMYVDIDYVEGDSAFTFTVSHSDKTISEKKVTFHNNYVTAGTYDMKDQSIHLNLREGEEVVIDCAQLLDEWIADEGTKTPIILKKEENLYGEGQYNHVPKYQDILSADIRIKDELRDPNTSELLPPENGIYKKSSGSTNILSRTYDSRELYVDGKADNIIYYGADGKTNVKDELDKLNKLRISSDSKNIIVGKFDGFFASVDIAYEKTVEDGSTVQKLILYTSGLDASGNVITNKAKEIEIPIAQFIDEVWYDESTEELVISYIDGKGDKRYTRINVGSLIDEWDVYNEAHSVKLQKQRSVSGKDLLSADVKITTSHPNNILVDVNHELYVRGEADNIKYTNTTGSTSSSTTVQEAIDKLTKAVSDEIADRTADVIAEQTRAENAEAELQSSLDEEIANARDAENVLVNKIGTGFTDDPHENVTAKFNELNSNLNGEQARAEEAENELRNDLTNESARAEEAENELRNDLTAEINRAEGVENDLRSDLTTETNRATNAETVLTNKIGTGFTDQANANVTFKFNALTDEVNAEETRAKTQENVISGKLDTEIADRIAYVNAEETRAISAETALQTAINNEAARAEGVEQGLRTDLTAETTRATSAETALQTAINNEVARATTNENTISGKLDTEISDRKIEAVHYVDYNPSEKTIDFKNKNGVTIDSIDATNFIKDGMIQSVYVSGQTLVITWNTDAGVTTVTIPFSQIFDPENYYTKDGVDTISGNLQTAINNEVTRATNAENHLRSDLTAETNRAQSAETALQTALQTAINNEVTRATNVENALSGAIATEKSRAESVEQGLRNDVNTISGNTNQEISDRKAYAFHDVEYSKTDKKIYFKNGNSSTIKTIDATDFIKDGMVENVVISDGKLVITFNTDSGKSDIEIPLTSIFNPDNYYTKAEVNASQSTQDDKINTISGNVTTISGNVTTISGDVQTLRTSATTNANNITTLSGKIDAVSGNVNTISGNVSANTSNISTLRTSLTTVSGKADTNASNISTLTSNLSTESANRANGDTEIKNIIGGYSTANTVYQAVTAETAARTGDIQTLRTSATTNANNITTLSGKINTISGDVQTLKTSATTNANNITTLSGKIDAVSGNVNTISGNTNKEISDRKAEAVHSADYVKGDNKIYLRNSVGVALSEIDTTDFIVDGMIQSVYVSGSSLVITWNTDAQHTPTTVTIPFSQIFNPDNYYTKAEVNALQAAQDNKISTISGSVNTISGNVNTISGDVQTLKTSVSANTNSISTLTERVSGITNNVNAISGDVINLQNQITAATGDTSALNDKLNAISGNVNSITSSTLTLQKNGTSIGTFKPGTSTTINIPIPTSVTGLTDYNTTTSTLSLPTTNISGTLNVSGPIYSTSDVNLKENINDVDFLKKVAAHDVKIKEFNFKDDPNKSKVYGVIAQEVESQGLGEVVTTKDDGHKAVDYTSLMLLKIAYLENENALLHSSLNKLQMRIEQLENK